MYYLFDDYESKFYKLLSNSPINDCKDIQRSYIEDKVYSTIRINEDFGHSYCSSMMLYHDIYNCFIQSNKKSLLTDYKIENYEDIKDELNLILYQKITINNLNKYHAYIITEHSFEDKFIIKIGFYHYPLHYSLDKELFCDLNENYLRYGLTATPNNPIYLSLNQKTVILNR